jgi:Leucine-rich repeat (LRR) protein
MSHRTDRLRHFRISAANILATSLLLLAAPIGHSPAALFSGGQEVIRLQSTTGPTPPPGVDVRGHIFEGIRIQAATVIPGVPAYIWRHGCGPTAVGMVIGYYDTHGYGGLIPGDSSVQGAAVNAAIASQGNYDDYCLPIDSYPNLLPDKSELPAGDEHADDSIADFMDTSQSVRYNYYGWSWDSDVTPGFQSYVNLTGAGESTASAYYFWSFSWASLMNEIDNLRPLVFLVDTDGNNQTDHFVTVVGYNSDGGVDYYGCYNTWDQSVHWYEYREMGSGIGWGVYRIHTFTMSSGVPMGALQVDLSPAEAVAAGAQWNVDSGAWQDSGATVTGLSIGNHTVSYKSVSGWAAPPSESVMITDGVTTQLTRSYGQAVSAVERNALIALYNSTNGDSWTNNAGWKTPPLHTDGFAMPGTEDSWFGVTADNLVREISLWSNNLQGTIPVQIGSLSGLYSLGLSDNQLAGTIPPELGNVSNLTFLNLSSNQLSGSLPPSLGGLTSLVDLDLSSNQLTGPIPPELGNLVFMDNRLNLSNNQLSGTIPASLGALNRLDDLYLNDNQLSGPIPSELRSMTGLYILALQNNQLSGPIPPLLGSLAVEIRLDLSGNALTGQIPPELGNLRFLRGSLRLNGNRLSGPIPASLANLDTISAIDLGYNSLYTDDPELVTFLDFVDPDWAATQTVEPTDVTAVGIGANTVQVSWMPIAYTADPGGYRVFWSNAAGGPYAFAGQTADKSAVSLAVTGLIPATPYYFVVQTRTEAHENNQNILDSGDSEEATGATLVQALIMGGITLGGLPLANVTLTGLPGSPVTDPSGVYQGLVDIGWSGTVTPTLTGHSFEPPSRTYGAGVASDVLAQDYTATLAPATVTVTSPNGGERLAAGSVHDVTWTTMGTIENVRIEYSGNNGTDWLTVIETTTNPGSYSWAVPGPASTGCLVRVSDAANAAVADTSDSVFRIVVKEDLLATWDGQGVYYRNSDTGGWVKLASPAAQVTAGDLDCDGIDDLIGVWPSQGGVWAKLSTDGWVRLSSSTPRDIAAGDMDGDGCDELVGTWDGQGVYMLTSIGGSWVKLASPATLIAVGNLDCDDKDDLIGIWPGQGGVWVKLSSTGAWIRLGSTPRHIAAGDMDGDGCDELLGTWDGQGVYYLASIGGAWVKMASPADLITSGDLDADGTDDLIGIWPTQGGVWVKYSETGVWARLSSTARDISAGVMRLQSAAGGSATDAPEGAMMAAGQALEQLPLPMGGTEDGPGVVQAKRDLSDVGPGGARFVFIEDLNTEPEEGASARLARIPGPGEPGFIAEEQNNQIPGERPDRKREGTKKTKIKGA